MNLGVSLDFGGGWRELTLIPVERRRKGGQQAKEADLAVSPSGLAHRHEVDRLALDARCLIARFVDIIQVDRVAVLIGDVLNLGLGLVCCHFEGCAPVCEQMW